MIKDFPGRLSFPRAQIPVKCRGTCMLVQRGEGEVGGGGIPCGPPPCKNWRGRLQKASSLVFQPSCPKLQSPHPPDPRILSPTIYNTSPVTPHEMLASLLQSRTSCGGRAEDKKFVTTVSILIFLMWIHFS